MTKAELINLIAEKGDYSKKDAEKALTTVIDSVSETLSNGEKISLVGLSGISFRLLVYSVLKSLAGLECRNFLSCNSDLLLCTRIDSCLFSSLSNLECTETYQ